MKTESAANFASSTVVRLAHEALSLSVEERLLLCRLVKPNEVQFNLAQIEERRIEFARLGKGELSAREMSVGQYVIGGATNKEIARVLDISTHTVELHRSRAIDKLGADSTADFVRLATAVGVQPLFARVRI